MFLTMSLYTNVGRLPSRVPVDIFTDGEEIVTFVEQPMFIVPSSPTETDPEFDCILLAVSVYVDH